MSKNPSIFMPSPINAVLEGFYEANTTMAELKQQGDFGIGTFNDLDGELAMLDGVIYQLTTEGGAKHVDDEEKTPFAAVCFFEPVTTEAIETHLDYKQLNAFLEQCIPSRNMMHAIRIDGEFSHVRTRSVRRTENYTPLVEATATQAISEFNDIEGTLIGFYTPEFIPSVNVPGYHFHFITSDRSGGGHLLECDLTKGNISIQFYARLDLNLPMTLDYLSADFKRNAAEDIEKAER